MRRAGIFSSAVISVIFMVISICVLGEEFTLSRNGEAKAEIYVLPGTPNDVQIAVKDLKKYLDSISGGNFIVTGEIRDTPIIVVGLVDEWDKLKKGLLFSARLSSASPESFLILSSSTHLFVLGKDSNGVCHGIYTLLKDLGCRWYLWGKEWETIPKIKNISMDVDRVEGPAFKIRTIFSGRGAGGQTAKLFKDWLRRNRMGSSFSGGVRHSYAGFVPQKLFKDHPEYFAWMDSDKDGKGNKQNGLQPCTTNPEVVKMFTEGALKLLREKKDTTMLAVSPNDGTVNMCRCERCRAVGSYSDCALLLANQVAEAIQSEFPNTLVGFYAYGWTAKPPQNITKAHPNVYVELATGYIYKTTLEEMLEKWPKIVRNIGIREYYDINDWGGYLPDYKGPNVKLIADRIKAWHRNGIIGINAEIAYDQASVGHRLWIASELMWNPDRNAESLLSDFYRNCWGEASVPMRKYYERWENGDEANARVIALAMQDIEEAAKLARTPEVITRVDLMSLYLHYILLRKEFELTKDEQRKADLAREGDEFSYRWKSYYMVLQIPPVFSILRGINEGYSHEEVSAMRKADIERLRNHDGIPVEFPKIDYLLEKLIPYNKECHDMSRYKWAETGGEYSKKCSYVFRASKDEVVKIEFNNIDKNASREFVPTIRLLSGEDNSKSFPAKPELLKSDDTNAIWTIKAPADGSYQMDVKANGYGHVNFPGKAFCINTKSSNIFTYFAVSRRFNLKGKMADRYYFFVPKGTRYFSVCAYNNGLPIDIEVTDPDGEAIKTGELSTGSLSKDDELIVTVPDRMDNAVWAVSIAGKAVSLHLNGIPPYLSIHPSSLLVPEDMVSKKTK